MQPPIHTHARAIPARTPASAHPLFSSSSSSSVWISLMSSFNVCLWDGTERQGSVFVQLQEPRPARFVAPRTRWKGHATRSYAAALKPYETMRVVSKGLCQKLLTLGMTNASRPRSLSRSGCGCPTARLWRLLRLRGTAAASTCAPTWAKGGVERGRERRTKALKMRVGGGGGEGRRGVDGPYPPRFRRAAGPSAVGSAAAARAPPPGSYPPPYFLPTYQACRPGRQFLLVLGIGELPFHSRSSLRATSPLSEGHAAPPRLGRSYPARLGSHAHSHPFEERRPLQ